MTHLPGESAHQTYPATPEEVEALGRQTELLVHSQGKPLEFSPHVLSLRGHEIARELVPEHAQAYLQLAGELIDFHASTNLRTGRTAIELVQLAMPKEYPACIFKNSVTYELTGEGQKTSEAAITNTRFFQTIFNLDYPVVEPTHIEQAEVQQLAQLLGSSSLQRAILSAE